MTSVSALSNSTWFSHFWSIKKFCLFYWCFYQLLLLGLRLSRDFVCFWTYKRSLFAFKIYVFNHLKIGFCVKFGRFRSLSKSMIIFNHLLTWSWKKLVSCKNRSSISIRIHTLVDLNSPNLWFLSRTLKILLHLR